MERLQIPRTDSRLECICHAEHRGGVRPLPPKRSCTLSRNRARFPRRDQERPAFGVPPRISDDRGISPASQVGNPRPGANAGLIKYLRGCDPNGPHSCSDRTREPEPLEPWNPGTLNPIFLGLSGYLARAPCFSRLRGDNLQRVMSAVEAQCAFAGPRLRVCGPGLLIASCAVFAFCIRFAMISRRSRVVIGASGRSPNQRELA